MHALARRQAANLAMLVLGLLALSIIVFHAPFSRISIGAEFLVFSIVMPAVYAAACVLLLGCLWIFRERAVRIPLAMMAAAVGIHAAADILYAQAQVGNTYGATHYLNIKLAHRLRPAVLGGIRAGHRGAARWHLSNTDSATWKPSSRQPSSACA